jgi:hypothetical protein
MLQLATRFKARVARNRKFKQTPYKYDFQTVADSGSVIPVGLQKQRTVRRVKSVLGSEYVGERDLPDIDYILYPLHAEPEIVLSQFARPYLNQIEVVRNIGLSMPICMRLLLKEHPMMVGRRPVGYYEKLLEIPNVRLIEMDLPSQPVLEHAKMVVIIRGAIGLEAVIKKIPVVSLGMSMFQLLPSTMFRTCWNLYELPNTIREMLEHYCYDHESLIRYLVAVMEGSAEVNLVSDLLAKPGRFRSDGIGEYHPFEEHPHLDDLAAYMLDRIRAGVRSGSETFPREETV